MNRRGRRMIEPSKARRSFLPAAEPVVVKRPSPPYPVLTELTSEQKECYREAPFDNKWTLYNKYTDEIAQKKGLEYDFEANEAFSTIGGFWRAMNKTEEMPESGCGWHLMREGYKPKSTLEENKEGYSFSFSPMFTDYKKALEWYFLTALSIEVEKYPEVDLCGVSVVMKRSSPNVRLWFSKKPRLDKAGACAMVRDIFDAKINDQYVYLNSNIRG